MAPPGELPVKNGNEFDFIVISKLLAEMLIPFDDKCTESAAVVPTGKALEKSLEVCGDTTAKRGVNIE